MKELLGSLELNRIYQIDCIEGMKLIPDKSVDAIITDLPYGTTKCKWDDVIPFNPLWEQYERIIKDNGAIVLFGSQPFTSALVMSNPKLFKYEIIWDKVNVSNPLLAKKQVLKSHENILLFYKKQCTYNPQMTEGTMWRRAGGKSKTTPMSALAVNMVREAKDDTTNLKYPKSIQTFSNADNTKRVHPTQKNLELVQWLVRTYTNENETILDSCMGSGTLAIASKLEGRKFIGFETDAEYIEVANKRLDDIED